MRLGIFLAFMPFFTLARVPARVRVLFTVALAASFVGSGIIPVIVMPESMSRFTLAAGNEIVVGTTLLFGFVAGFSAFSFGGRIIDFQLGFGVAGLIDPITNTQTPLLGTLLQWVAVVTFLLADGHLLFMKALAHSFEAIPAGGLAGIADPRFLGAQFGLMFTAGLAAVAPVVFVLLIIDLGMAIAGRTMPQVNMFIVGLPIKIAVGLGVLMASMPLMAALLRRTYEAMFAFWERALVL